MTGVTTLTAGGREIALALHTVLREQDPARWRGEAAAHTRERLSALAARTHALLEATRAARDERLADLRGRLTSMRASLEVEAADVPDEPAAWVARHRSLQQHYEALASSLRAHRVHVPSLRPTNYARNLFHVAWGTAALAVVQWLLPADALIWVSGSFATYAWTLELLRRRSPEMNARIMRLYGKVAHPHEWHQINSGTWYATALVVLSMTNNTLLCLVPVAILTYADPAAALVGRRFGRIRLVHGRSLEGTLAFFVVGCIAAFVAAWLGQGVPVLSAAVLAVSAAACAAIAELVSHRVDDNLTIPLAGLAGAWTAALLTGLAL